MKPERADDREAVFRKSAVERLSSPEEFNDLAGIIRPLDWLALSALGLLILGALGWATFGRLAVTVPAEGLLLPPEPPGRWRQAVMFVAEGSAGQIRPGLEVRLRPRSLPGQAFPHVQGTVARVTPSPVSEPALQGLLLYDARAQDLLARGLRIRVDVELRQEPARALADRTEVVGEIVLRHERPFARVLPWVRGAGS